MSVFPSTALPIWLCLALMSPSPALAQELRPGPDDSGAAWQKLDETVVALAKKRGSVGFALSVLVDGKPRWQRSRGLRAAGGLERFDLDSPVPLGQISGLYLVAAALRLAEAGQLDLDASVTDIVPGLRIGRAPGQFRAPTVREILLGRSGLGMGRLQGRYCVPGECMAPADPDAELYLLTPPSLFGGLPSAQAMDLLARVLVAASGLDIDTLIEREVVAPLGLTMPLRSQPVPLHEKGATQPGLIVRDSPALSAVASLQQLQPLIIALLAPREESSWLPWSQRQRFFTAQPVPGPAMPWARAAYLFQLPERPRDDTGDIARIGSVFPLSDARIVVVPRHGIAVLAAANFDPEDASLAEAIDQALRAALSEVGVDLPERDQDGPPLPEAIALPEGFQDDRLASGYATLFGLVESEPDGADYKTRAAGWNFTASRREDGWLRVRLRILRIPIGLSFLKRLAVRPVRYQGQRLLLMATANNTMVLGSELPIRAGNAEARTLAGRYRLINPDFLSRQAGIESVDLVVEQDTLMIRLSLPGVLGPTLTIPLRHESGPIWASAGLAPGLGERFGFESDTGSMRMHYSGYILERQ